MHEKARALPEFALEFDVTAVCASDLAGERQAEPRAGKLRVEPVERLEDMLAFAGTTRASMQWSPLHSRSFGSIRPAGICPVVVAQDER